MRICGFQVTSFVDYPGEVCSTVFTGSCNLRCPFCFNSDLVLRPEQLPQFSEEEIFSLLKKRIDFQGALCITGGEPALQADLLPFITKSKSMDLRVKLDTNGTCPEVLEKLLEAGILDYVAMDYKAPPQKYNLLTGANIDYSKIEQTITLLRSSPVAYEFRTTVVPSLLDENDLLEIANVLKGSRQLVFQQFKPLPTLLDERLLNEQPYSGDRIEKVASLCRDLIHSVLLRGF